MGDIDKRGIDLALAITRRIGATGVGKELDAIIPGNEVEIEVDADRPPLSVAEVMTGKFIRALGPVSLSLASLSVTPKPSSTPPLRSMPSSEFA